MISNVSAIFLAVVSFACPNIPVCPGLIAVFSVFLHDVGIVLSLNHVFIIIKQLVFARNLWERYYHSAGCQSRELIRAFFPAVFYLVHFSDTLPS